MNRQNPNNWLDEFIFNDALSDESIYAIYNFLTQILMQIEMKALHKLRNYAQAQEEINRCRYEFQSNEDPF